MANQLSSAEATELAERLSELSASGLPAGDGLRAAASDASSRRLAGVLRMIAAEVDRGVPLEQALGRGDRRLPAYVQGLIRAGIRSGDLAGVLTKMVQADRYSQQSRREIRLALAYPLILILATLLLMLFVGLFIIPQFRSTFEEFDVQLPAVTRLTLAFGDMVGALIESTVSRGLLIALAVVLGAYLGVVALNWIGWSLTDRGAMRSLVRGLQPLNDLLRTIRVWPARLLSTAPLLGPLLLWHAVAQWSRLLAGLVDADVPLPEALALAAQGVRSANVADLAARLAAGVEGGQTLSGQLQSLFWMPASLAPLVQWGEKTGQLAEALRTSADMLEGRIRLRASLLKQVAPPVMFLLVASLVLFALAAVFVPLISLIQNLA